MKKLIVFNIYFLFFVIIVNSQIINFPDSNFVNKLMQSSPSSQIALNLTYNNIKIDSNNNGTIEQIEAQQVGLLNVSLSSIADLSGIGYFTNLRTLICHYNLLNELNLSSLTQLVALQCNNNNLSSLNLSGLLMFESLRCDYNNISAIDFINVPNLKSVVCFNNQISNLNFSSNSIFNQLYCRNNNLTSINIKNNTNHDFSNSNLNDCWKTGNPNLTTICVDASEAASVQSFLDGCGTPQSITVTSNCGLANETFIAGKLKIYPNPATTTLAIVSNETINKLSLLDFQGRLLQTNSINSYEATLDVSSFTSGIYFIKAETTLGTTTEKIIIKQ